MNPYVSNAAHSCSVEYHVVTFVLQSDIAEEAYRFFVVWSNNSLDIRNNAEKKW